MEEVKLFVEESDKYCYNFILESLYLIQFKYNKIKLFYDTSLLDYEDIKVELNSNKNLELVITSGSPYFHEKVRFRSREKFDLFNDVHVSVVWGNGEFDIMLHEN